MFAGVTRDSNARLTEVRELLDFIRAASVPAPAPEPLNIKISKGLFFVHLYGAYEFTITSTISKTIELLNLEAPRINDCKPLLWSLILNSDLDAIAGIGANKWPKRHSLFQHVIDNSSCSISPELMPTNGKNLALGQLNTIWKSFSISSPVLPREELGGRIQELIRNRNDIAHGLAPAADVGSLNTITELYTRHSEVSEICTYAIQTFEDYIAQKRFLNSV